MSKFAYDKIVHENKQLKQKVKDLNKKLEMYGMMFCGFEQPIDASHAKKRVDDFLCIP